MSIGRQGSGALAIDRNPSGEIADTMRIVEQVLAVQRPETPGKQDGFLPAFPAGHSHTGVGEAKAGGSETLLEG
jgi:hypothetical protein